MQKPKNYNISVIIPVFNAAKSLPELSERLTNSLMTMKVNFELIFVDDFSKDNSWEVLTEIQQTNKNITIIRFARNFGQHNATICGIAEAKGDTIITIDDDLEHPPEIIPQLFSQFNKEQRDLFYAIPKKRKKNILRNNISALWSFLSKTAKSGSGKGSSFRIIKREIADHLLLHKEPFVFIESILFWYTKNIGHQEIEFEERKHGVSNYSTRRLLFLSHDIGMGYNTSILRLMMFGGEIVSVFSFLLIFYYLFKKIFGNPIQGYTSLIVVILFSTGALMWSMGYLGLYIGKIMRIINKEPQYNISKKIKN